MEIVRDGQISGLKNGYKIDNEKRNLARLKVSWLMKLNKVYARDRKHYKDLL
jgi:hypothetical protein